MLKQKDQARETSIKRTRALIRACGEGIRHLHRGKRQEAEERARIAGQIAAELRGDLETHPDLLHSNSVESAMAEYAELIVVMKLLTERRMPSFAEIGVSPASYLNGLGDAIGEIRRHILNLLRKRQTRDAEDYLEIAETMYEMLLGFDYPKAIVGDLRRKQDVARSLLERTRADVTNAVLQADFLQRLQSKKK